MKSHRTRRGAAWPLLLACWVAGPAQAAIVTFGDAIAWRAALGQAPTATQNFNGYTRDLETYDGGLDLGGGMRVESALTQPIAVFRWRVDVPGLLNELECSVDRSAQLCGHNANVLTFRFEGGVSAFGANFASLNNDEPRTLFELYGGDTLLATLAPPVVAGQTDRFFGFVATAGEVVTHWRTRALVRDSFGIDDIAIVSARAVPEPGSAGLVAAALGAWGLAAGRRRGSRGRAAATA